jgi:hypothetical protein
VSEEWEFSLAVCRFLVQQATVTLQNNEHDDSQASAAAHPLSPRLLARRFFHPQLPKFIIARLQEWKSGIVRSSCYAEDLVADMATLNINDNTSDSVSTLRSIGIQPSPSTRELGRKSDDSGTRIRPGLLIGTLPFTPVYEGP